MIAFERHERAFEETWNNITWLDKTYVHADRRESDWGVYFMQTSSPRWLWRRICEKANVENQEVEARKNNQQRSFVKLWENKGKKCETWLLRLETHKVGLCFLHY